MSDINGKKIGRPKGSHNKASKKQIAEMKAKGITPLDYLSSIYQNEAEDIRLRIDAAKAAAPYIHSRLSSTEVHAAIEELSHEEWIKRLS